jgi:hypothetical protein
MFADARPPALLFGEDTTGWQPPLLPQKDPAVKKKIVKGKGKG